MTNTAGLVPYPVNALLFIGALLPALFFKGPQLEFFALTHILLTGWLARILWFSYPQGLTVPRTSLALALTLFWGWLALSAVVSPAPAVSTVNFWWVGALPFTFWLYTLSPDRDAVWRFAAPVVLLIALTLALVTVHQVYVFEAAARSVFETRNTHAAFLNLVALPASAYFLLGWHTPGVSRGQRLFLGGTLLTLFFSVFLTAGRGASLSLLISFLLLLVLVWRHVKQPALLTLVGLLVAAFVLTQFSHGGLGARLPAFTQDVARLLIWESSWEMVRDHPWLGVGLGLFFLAYPPYRQPADSSGGFFAHNDYLQIWAETGLAGLILLVAVLASVAVLSVRAWRRPGLDGETRVELAGLFTGLFAIAGHSVVDFNFYILSILMVAGLVLGRWHARVGAVLSVPVWQVRVSRWLSSRTYPVNVVMLVSIGFVYFASVGLTNSFYERALSQARQGEVEAASRTLANAAALNPRDDRAPLTHADLYRHVLRLRAGQNEQDLRALFEDAQQYLDEAVEANPLRALPHMIRARLFREQPALAGAGAAERALEAYARALALNPLMFVARTEHAQLLLELGRVDEARATLEAGIDYRYPDVPDVMPFFRLTARTWRQTGENELAADLEARIAEIESRAQTSYAARPP